MCRLLAYLGQPVSLEAVLYQPEHSLIVQSYQPQELETALLNADGFGVGWYDTATTPQPYTYRHTQPIWHDVNLPDLSRYIQSPAMLAYVRSATPGLAVDLSNCQPFRYENLLFIHNGFIEQFRRTVYRPLRDRLSDRAYQAIHGLTDSEHLFALFIDAWEATERRSLSLALESTLLTAAGLARSHQVRLAANIIISDGTQLVASRFDTTDRDPSLYWLRDSERFPQAVLLASEPLYPAPWLACTPASVLTVHPDLSVDVHAIASPVS